jgi:hypothetical protein
MFPKAWVRCAAMVRQRSPFRRGTHLLAALALAALTAACAAPPPAPVAGADPSDPSAPAKPVGYRSAIGPYEAQRPVEPKPWQEQNQRVGPSQRQQP